LAWGGPNGAGKTTKLKMLIMLLPARARVAGLDIVCQASEVQRIMGYVPQMLVDDGTLTGHQNLLNFAKLYDLPRGGREQHVRETLAFMGIADAADKLGQDDSPPRDRPVDAARTAGALS
jgi:ABC-2 type transport system ATP-binding protein